MGKVREFWDYHKTQGTTLPKTFLVAQCPNLRLHSKLLSLTAANAPSHLVTVTVKSRNLAAQILGDVVEVLMKD